MRESFNEYFANFNTGLVKKYVHGVDLDKFFADVDGHKFTLSGLGRYQFDESIEYDWLDKLEFVTEKIMAIASDPRSHIKVYKEVKNSEQAVKISNVDIIETLKVPKFWKLKGDDYLPEKIYTDTFDIELAIYENRFIIALIDKMMIFLSKVIAAQYKKVRYINRDYINGAVSLDNAGDIIHMSDEPLFDEYGLIEGNRTNSSKQNRVDIKDDKIVLPYTLLTTSDAPYIQTLARLIEARKKLSHVLSTPFYKTVKKAKPLGESDIHITNMLAGDKSYAPCFLFYRELTLLMSEGENEEFQIKGGTPQDVIANYQDYVSLNLIKAFNLLKFSYKKSALPFKNTHILFKNFELKKDKVHVKLNSSRGQIIMEFTVTNAAKKENAKKLTSKVSIDVVPTVNELYPSGEELELYFKKTIQARLKKGFTNAFVVTANDENQKDDVILCSPYYFKVDSNLVNMIKSCLIFSEGDEFIYSNLCPVCGFYVDGEQEDGNCYCSNCDSAYTILKKSNGKETVWIKRLKNPNDQ